MKTMVERTLSPAMDRWWRRSFLVKFPWVFHHGETKNLIYLRKLGETPNNDGFDVFWTSTSEFSMLVRTRWIFGRQNGKKHMNIHLQILQLELQFPNPSHVLTFWHFFCPFKGLIFTGIIPTPSFEATDITSLASWNGASQAGGLAENTLVNVQEQTTTPTISM